ncbi:PREDICTED: C-type lectin domain family 7 member A-like isoform X1 [Gekko japonicus]|uniref:C-type lectin domain family 7 member A-like isoform X1 n=1 Tax=Gekko japonicus TaxID=146911 RepID=A0ABM1K2Z2_GEKJA|nr:PREDICTED: C-type lectin domain family 7 member A-like isoform X1 [Gekko japonicus]
MVADLSEGTGGRSDCENPVGKNLANGHMVNASEQEMLFLQGHLVKGGICANGNGWKVSTIGLLVLLAISVTLNICVLVSRRSTKFKAQLNQGAIGCNVGISLPDSSPDMFAAKLCLLPVAPHPPNTTSATSDASPCPQRWVMNQGRCYFFSDTEATWNASRINCSSQGGSLVAMDTPQEWEFVLDSRRLTYFWLDFWREGVGKPWKQADGSLFNNTFPILGEGLCSYMNERSPSSTWCDNSRHWICTKPIHGH